MIELLDDIEDYDVDFLIYHRNRLHECDDDYESFSISVEENE